MAASEIIPASPKLTSDAELNARGRRKRQWQTTLAFWGFVGPMMLGLIIFAYIPIIWGLVLSFFDARNTITPTNFVGLDNYASIIGDDQFRNSIVTILIFALFIVPITVFFSLWLAVMVNTVRFARAFFRSVFFLPTACSYVVASLVWRITLFNGLPYGFANNIIYFFGLDPIIWIGTANPPYYWVVLVTVRLWLQVGFYMILYLAGLQDIPKELYEAAYVDGARPGWATFSRITFPLLRNTTIAVLLLNLIAAFQAFDEFYNILGAKSGLALLARPPLVYLYNIAFTNQNYGAGAAGGFILVGIIIVITLVQGKLLGFGRAENQ
jgi:multiple sugar transport system permease protein